MKLKKFDLRLKPETINSITQLADKKYFGNRSLCARDLLEKAVENYKTFESIAKEIVNDQKKKS